MLVLSVKLGHDGAVAAVQDSKLLFSLESEKDTHQRHATLDVSTLISIAELLPEPPDVVAVSGWSKRFDIGATKKPAGYQKSSAGYQGPYAIAEWMVKLFGSETRPSPHLTSVHTS